MAHYLYTAKQYQRLVGRIFGGSYEYKSRIDIPYLRQD